MSPGRGGANCTSPGAVARKVFWKKLSPPKERVNDFRKPPVAFVSISMVVSWLTIAPDSARSDSPCSSETVTIENEGRLEISYCMLI
jgi:hypothetical protein